MRYASSQDATCSAFASASEYTATVRMPRRFAVRATRTAISPRLAMRILSNIQARLTTETRRTRRKPVTLRQRSIRFSPWPPCLRGSLLSFHPRRRALLQKRIGPFLPFCSHANARDTRGRVFCQRLIDRPVHYACDEDRKSTRLNSSHVEISYAVFCLKKKH